jgi:hypothetical protein
MSQVSELKARVEAKRKKLEADIARAKADAQGAANDRVERMEAKIADVRTMLKDGWEDLGESTARKLNDWLD